LLFLMSSGVYCESAKGSPHEVPWAPTLDSLELLGVGRLGPIGGGAKYGGRLVLAHARRKNDDRDGGPSGIVAQGGQKVPPVHDGHGQVDERDTGKLLRLIAQQGQRDFPVFRFHDFVTVGRKDLTRELAMVCVVVDDENLAHQSKRRPSYLSLPA